MIKLAVEDYCQNCSNFSPDVEINTLHTGYEEFIDTTVICKNQKFCKNLYSHLKEEIKND